MRTTSAAWGRRVTVHRFAERGDRFALVAVHGLGEAPCAKEMSPEEEFAGAFSRSAELLAARGLSLDEIGRITVFTPEPSFRPLINGPWLELFPDPENRPARKTTHAALPHGARVMLDVQGVRGGLRESLEIDGVRHRDPLPMGARLGRYVFSSVIPPDIPGGGQAVRGEAIEQVFRNAAALMHAGGGSMADVQNVWTYLGMWDLHPEMVDIWVGAFPSEASRPSRKTFYYPRTSCQLQVDGVLGGERRALEIPGLSHHDPIPMGALCAGVITTSGVDGRDPGATAAPRGVSAQSHQALRNLRTLLTGAGGGIEDLFHVTALLGEASYAPAFEEAWATVFSEPETGPALQLLPLGLPARDLLVQVIGEAVRPPVGAAAGPLDRAAT